MKKNYTLILTIVTVAAIIIGSIIHLGSCAKNGHFSYDVTLDKNSEGEGESRFGESYNQTFNNIELNICLIEVEVEEGNRFEVQYEGKEKYKPVVKTDGDTLRISNNDRNISISVAVGKNLTSKLKVTVPKGTTFDKANVMANMAKFDIEKLDAKELNLEANAAEINIGDTSGEKLVVGAHKGDVNLSGDYTDIEIESAIGNINIDLAQDVTKYQVSAHTDMGSVECGTVSAKGINSDSSQNGDLGNIEITCEMGNVDIH